MDHKQVRVVMERGAEVPPDVEREDKVVRWADALYANSMRIAAAGVLQAEGSLEKAASVLWWAGFGVPAGYFPEGHEGEDLSLCDEEALRLWVEGEAERIKNVTETIGFYLAGTGKLLDKADEYLR
jgi:hypothetical protein